MRQQRWGHIFCGKGWKGGARVYQKPSLPYLDSTEDDKEQDQGKGNSEEEEKKEGSPGTAGLDTGEGTLIFF